MCIRCTRREDEFRERLAEYSHAFAQTERDLTEQVTYWKREYNSTCQSLQAAHDEVLRLQEQSKRDRLVAEERYEKTVQDYEADIEAREQSFAAKRRNLLEDMAKAKDEHERLITSERDEHDRLLKSQKDAAKTDFNEYHALVLLNADYSQPTPDHHFKKQLALLNKQVTHFAALTKWEQYCDKEKLGEIFGQVSFAQIVQLDVPHLILEHAFWTLLCKMVFLTPFRVFGELENKLFDTWNSFSPQSLSPAISLARAEHLTKESQTDTNHLPHMCGLHRTLVLRSGDL